MPKQMLYVSTTIDMSDWYGSYVKFVHLYVADMLKLYFLVQFSILCFDNAVVDMWLGFGTKMTWLELGKEFLLKICSLTAKNRDGNLPTCQKYHVLSQSRWLEMSCRVVKKCPNFVSINTARNVQMYC